jgi:hypothetical protein
MMISKSTFNKNVQDVNQSFESTRNRWMMKLFFD